MIDKSRGDIPSMPVAELPGVHPLRAALLNWRSSLVTVGILIIWGTAVAVFGGM